MKKRPRLLLKIFCLYLAMPALLACLLTPSRVAALPGICVYSRFLGFSCPGCGMTRAVAFLLAGEPARALEFNPLVAVVAPLAIFLWAKSLAADLRRLSS